MSRAGQFLPWLQRLDVSHPAYGGGHGRLQSAGPPSAPRQILLCGGAVLPSTQPQHTGCWGLGRAVLHSGYVRTHTHTHTHMHEYAHTHIHECARTHTHPHTLTCTRVHTHTHSQSCMLAWTHAACMHTWSCTDTHMHAHTHTHIHTYTCMHTCSHNHTHTHNKGLHTHTVELKSLRFTILHCT